MCVMDYSNRVKSPKNNNNPGLMPSNYVASKTINIYFGDKHSDTLDRMDNLCDKLRMSRSSLIDYLVTFYEQYGVKDVPKQIVVNGNKYILV